MFSKLAVSTSSELIDAIEICKQSPTITFKNLDLLNKVWHKCLDGDRCDFFAEILSSYCKSSSFSTTGKVLDACNQYHSYRLQKYMPINSTKWVVPSFNEILYKIQLLATIKGISVPNIKKITTGFYLVSPSL